MKANEIQIGDWVQDITPVVINAISNEDICTYRAQYGYITANPSNLKPIPLTAEILEKNGFIPDNFSLYYLPIKDGSVRFSKHQYGLYCNILRPYQRYDGVCNYVHNLQHALRLCGIDKTIEL